MAGEPFVFLAVPAHVVIDLPCGELFVQAKCMRCPDPVGEEA